MVKYANRAQPDGDFVARSSASSPDAEPGRPAPIGPRDDNPVGRLQAELQSSWTRAEAPRWSPLQTATFVAVTSGLLWVAIVQAIVTLTHLS